MPKPTSSAIGVSPSSSAFSRLMTMSAAAPSEICDALPAVIVPSLANAGRSSPSDSVVVPGRTPFVLEHHHRVALALGDRHRRRSRRRAGLPSSRRRRARGSWPRSSSCSSRVMPAEAARVLLGARAHVHRVERAPQAVVDQRVDDLAVAHAVARPAPWAAGTARWSSTPCRRRRPPRRRRAWIIWSARYSALTPERHTLLIVIAGTLIGMPGVDRGLTGGDLALTGLEHLAHDHVVDLVGARRRRARARALIAMPPRSMRARATRARRRACRSACGRWRRSRNRAWLTPVEVQTPVVTGRSAARW